MFLVLPFLLFLFPVPYSLFPIFRVIASANYNPDPDPPFHGAIVRFHKIRPNNDWLGDDLEAYEREGILTIDWTNPAK